MQVYEQKNFKILLGDENVQFRNTLAQRLRIEGYHVEYVEGGFHLLHLMEKFGDYSLLILHENMRDMPSEEIISLLRNHKTKAELPILYISKNTSEEEITNMILLGANEYIVKSANMQPIVDRATKYFNLQKISDK